jgi:hypothetical protein
VNGSNLAADRAAPGIRPRPLATGKTCGELSGRESLVRKGMDDRGRAGSEPPRRLTVACVNGLLARRVSECASGFSKGWLGSSTDLGTCSELSVEPGADRGSLRAGRAGHGAPRQIVTTRAQPSDDKNTTVRSSLGNRVGCLGQVGASRSRRNRADRRCGSGDTPVEADRAEPTVRNQLVDLGAAHSEHLRDLGHPQ